LVNGENNFSGKTIRLTANIMLNDTADWRKWSEADPKGSSKVKPPKNIWTAIGSYTGENNRRPFSGSFDGRGKVISGVYINSSADSKGLFGWITSSATIKDLGLTASFVKGGSIVGGLVGGSGGTITNCYATGNVEGGSGLVGRNNGTITNSYATGNIKGGSGLVGSNEGGTITNCYATGNVNGGGGLVGSNEGGTITNSYAKGNVISYDDAGGLVGYNSNTYADLFFTIIKKKSIVENNYATGNVKGKDAGGLIGINRGTITDCYATGNVNGSENSGGLVGENGDRDRDTLKGIITNCYATGKVNGSKNSGGFVGNNEGSITKCYAMGNVRSNESAGGLIGSNEGTVTNCYAMGNVEGKTNGGLVGINSQKSVIENSYATGNVSGIGNTNGGLVGNNGSGTITTSYYDRQTSGQSDIVKGEPRSTTQMKQKAIFEGWNFNGIWKIDEKNNGYPYLQSSEKSLPVKYKYTYKVQQGNVLTDKRDGKKYKTVVINAQTWMAENLNYNANGSKCYGGGDNRWPKAEVQANCAKYGRLYDWKTAMKACPSGWHLPTHKEWNELENYADMYASRASSANYASGASGASKHLNATSGWYKIDIVGRDYNGTDDFGFSALPGGYYVASSSEFRGSGSFGHVGYWWSSFSESNSTAYHWRIYYYNGNEYIGLSSSDNSDLLSVRCIQD
jgi:uncharacterized protein (TIGR02145 family)